MAGIMAGLLGVLVVGAGITAYNMRPSARSGRQPTANAVEARSSASTDELRRLREAESEVERTCRETQDAIITRAMWRALRPMGGGSSE